MPVPRDRDAAGYSEFDGGNVIRSPEGGGTAAVILSLEEFSRVLGYQVL